MESVVAKLPLSYRFSQASILAALVVLASTAWGILSNLPQDIKLAMAMLSGIAVASSLLVSGYVIVRYPFLSLTPALAGDRFEDQLGMHNRWPVLILNILALAFFVMGVVLVPLRGIDTITEVLFVCYAIIMIPVLAFLIFVYGPVSHPTVATLIRSTFGIGIAFFPLYIPMLAIGSIRCNQMLNRITSNTFHRQGG